MHYNTSVIIAPHYCDTFVAEIYHFQHERVVDFREMMKLFLAEQIKFYEEVSNNCCVDVNSLIIIAWYNIIMC